MRYLGGWRTCSGTLAAAALAAAAIKAPTPTPTPAGRPLLLPSPPPPSPWALRLRHIGMFVAGAANLAVFLLVGCLLDAARKPGGCRLQAEC